MTMARERRRDSTSTRERRWGPPGIQVVTVVLLAELLLSTAFTVWPPTPSNRTTNALLALPLVVASCIGLWSWRRRSPLRLLEVLLVVSWLVPVAFVLTRQLEATQVLWGAVLMPVALIAALYLPTRRALVQVTAMVAAFLIAALTIPPVTHPMFASTLAAVMAVGAFGVGWLRRERDQLYAEIADMATTDLLTGLLNRRGLMIEAAVVHANATRSGYPTAIAIADLDGLKETNDTQGHDEGDALLVALADHCRSSLREGDLIGRVGGDEFVMVLPKADEATAQELLTRIRESAPARWSHGWTLWKSDEPFDEALRRADMAMYADKAGRRSGRDRRRAGR